MRKIKRGKRENSQIQGKLHDSSNIEALPIIEIDSESILYSPASAVRIFGKFIERDILISNIKIAVAARN